MQRCASWAPAVPGWPAEGGNLAGRQAGMTWFEMTENTITEKTVHAHAGLTKTTCRGHFSTPFQPSCAFIFPCLPCAQQEDLHLPSG